VEDGSLGRLAGGTFPEDEAGRIAKAAAFAVAGGSVGAAAAVAAGQTDPAPEDAVEVAGRAAVEDC